MLKLAVPIERPKIQLPAVSSRVGDRRRGSSHSSVSEVAE